MPRCSRSLPVALLLLVAVAPSRADSIDDQLAAIAKVGPEGAGSAQARAACEALSAASPEALPRLLAAMDTPNPVAANWYRVAYQAVVDRELAQPAPQWPLEPLQAFARAPKHSGRARRLALALCDRVDPNFSKTLIPQLVDDVEFRSEAVDAALAAGARALENGDSTAAREQFRRAFEHARDSQQTVRAAAQLTALGEKVDVAEHLGLVTRWWLIGPFDAPGFSGFERAFPPEQQVDLQAEYAGQGTDALKWKPHQETDVMGLVNLVQSLAPVKEAVGYAYAEVESPAAIEGQLRAGADDNCTVWLNGEKVLARGQWLNGHRLDRFVAPVRLKQGRNTVLVKVCQGPQHKDPQVPNNWSLQLRFCDASGKGLPLRAVSPSAEDCKP